MPLTLDAIYAETAATSGAASPLRLPPIVTPRDDRNDHHETSGAAAAASLEKSLRRKLARELTRVLDLFRAADVNVDGNISRHEFQDVLLSDPSLHLSSSASTSSAVDALFDQIDVDASGSISFAELNRVLRKALDDEATNAAARRHRVARGDRIPNLSELKAMPGTVEYYEGLMKLHKASPRPLPKPLPPREAQRQKREANRQELRERRKRMEAISRNALTDEAFRRMQAKQRARAAALERRRAAIVMQSHGRAAIARQREHAAREQRIRDRAAIALQARSRGHRERVHLEEKKVEALEALKAKARERLEQNAAFLEAYFKAAEERLQEDEDEEEEEEPAPALPCPHQGI